MLTEVIQEDNSFRTGIRMRKEYVGDIVGSNTTIFPASAVHTPWGMPFDPVHFLLSNCTVPWRYVTAADYFDDQPITKPAFKVRKHSGRVSKTDSIPKPVLSGLGTSLKLAIQFLAHGGSWSGDIPNAAYQEYKKEENPCTHPTYRGTIITNNHSNVYQYDRVIGGFDRYWRADDMVMSSSGGTVTSILPSWGGWGTPNYWSSHTQNIMYGLEFLQATIDAEEPYKVDDNWYCYLREIQPIFITDETDPRYGCIDRIYVRGWTLVRPFGWVVELKVEWEGEYVFIDHINPLPVSTPWIGTSISLSTVHQVQVEVALSRVEYYRCRREIDCGDDVPTDWTPTGDSYAIFPTGETLESFICVPYFHDLPVSYVAPGFNEVRLYDLVTLSKGSISFDPGRTGLVDSALDFVKSDVLPEVLGGLAISGAQATEDALSYLLDSNVETVVELMQAREQVRALINPINLAIQLIRHIRRGDAWGAGNTVLDLLSNAYLLYTFGIAPNMRAAKEIVNAFLPIVERLLNGGFRQYMTGRGKFTFPLPDSPRGVRDVVVRFRTKVQLRYADNSIVSVLMPFDLFGLLPMFSAFWDTRAFSWMTDWYTNLGAKFSLLDSQVRTLMLDIAGSTSSIDVEIPIPPGLLARYGSVPGPDQPRVAVFCRTVTSDVPRLIPPRKYDLLPPQNETKWTILAALAYQFGKG